MQRGIREAFAHDVASDIYRCREGQVLIHITCREREGRGSTIDAISGGGPTKFTPRSCIFRTFALTYPPSNRTCLGIAPQTLCSSSTTSSKSLYRRRNR
jgi:hypothetical protein